MRVLFIFSLSDALLRSGMNRTSWTCLTAPVLGEVTDDALFETVEYGSLDSVSAPLHRARYAVAIIAFPPWQERRSYPCEFRKLFSEKSHDSEPRRPDSREAYVEKAQQSPALPLILHCCHPAKRSQIKPARKCGGGHVSR